MAGTNIMDLPDCVLHHILSLLPSTEDVVRTSILAKRWKYFWTFLPALDIKFRPPHHDTLDFPNGIRFPCLNTLNLYRVFFANENSAQQLFSGCLVLQELTLDNISWGDIRQITIAISTLKKLTIRFEPCFILYDYYFENCSIKIDAMNLVSLSCTSMPIFEFIPINLTSVVDAYIDLKHDYPQDVPYAVRCAIQLLRGLNSVKSLVLSNDTLELLDVKDTLHLLPLFHNLTYLHVLSGQHLDTSETLKGILPKTPKLEVLQIRTVLDGEIWTFNSMPRCFKSSLKLVCISDFYGEENQIEFVQFLLENATSLREIKIFWAIGITSEFEMMDHIMDQLQPSPFSKCVITFQ